MHDHNGGSPRLAFAKSSSGVANQPLCYSLANTAPYGSWVHLIGTWDGAVDAYNMIPLINGSESRGDYVHGSGSLSSAADSSEVFVLATDEGETASEPSSFSANVVTSTAT